MSEATVHEGLEGVMVARTTICQVDGAGGHLLVRGYAIEQLSGKVSFEALVGLLVDGELPETPRAFELQRELGRGRERAFQLLSPRFSAIVRADAMGTLRSAVSLLDGEAELADVIGMVAVASAGWIRHQQGEQLLAPRPGLPHALDFLRCARGGDVPAPADAALLEAYLVTVAEHGLNASTFAARVTASTGADLAAAVVAGLAALSGPLHGGAPGPVLDMLDAIGTTAGPAAYVERELAAGRRIMGMGHRVYRVRDPRALVLERALIEYARGVDSPRLALARAVESAAERALAERYPKRALRANVEFYTALLLEALGVPREAFTAVFACARVAGYAAHVTEQRERGRLIRPAALYVGRAAEVARQ